MAIASQLIAEGTSGLLSHNRCRHAAFRRGRQPVRQQTAQIVRADADRQQCAEGSRRKCLLSLAAVLSANPLAPAHAGEICDGHATTTCDCILLRGQLVPTCATDFIADHVYHSWQI